ncbi:hypothetical protein FY036_16410 [Mesorhizobium microcysteis]|uniref:Uncharacterized protein n=1 Tax=Neoaquamicrobium microcysteis TaxID=2682781 RepID=A0A5D4GRM6_9HYPH|nr:hypothetical protein [Mesorhizobium microcysteis]TYR31017.1 hypothetical protein FY036_16410 [Mesorhizobium microcysteis]
MSLALLVIIVVVGIAAVVAAVHLTGGSAPARLSGEEAARTRFAVDYPEMMVGRVWLTREGDAAFLELENGHVGIVHAIGGKFLTRLVAASDLTSAPRASDSELLVRFRDFTWPGGIFGFADGQEAKAVETMFSALRKAALWEKT